MRDIDAQVISHFCSIVLLRFRTFSLAWLGKKKKEFVIGAWSSSEKGLKIRTEQDTNRVVRQAGALLHQLSYQVNWELFRYVGRS